MSVQILPKRKHGKIKLSRWDIAFHIFNGTVLVLITLTTPRASPR